jgi:hypothetical protein
MSATQRKPTYFRDHANHTADSSHDAAHPDNSTLYIGVVRPYTGFVASLFFISPRTRHGSS